MLNLEKRHKYFYVINKGFNGVVVNQALPSLQWGPFKIPHTAPLTILREN